MVGFESFGNRKPFHDNMLLDALSGGRITSFFEMLEKNDDGGPPTSFDREKLTGAILAGMRETLSRGEMDQVDRLETFSEKEGLAIRWDDPEVGRAVLSGLRSLLRNVSLHLAGRLFSFARERKIPFRDDHELPMFFAIAIENAKTADDVKKIVSLAEENGISLVKLDHSPFQQSDMVEKMLNAANK